MTKVEARLSQKKREFFFLTFWLLGFPTFQSKGKKKQKNERYWEDEIFASFRVTLRFKKTPNNLRRPRATTDTEESSANPKNEQKPDMQKVMNYRASLTLPKAANPSPSAPPEEPVVASAPPPVAKKSTPVPPARGLKEKKKKQIYKKKN